MQMPRRAIFRLQLFILTFLILPVSLYAQAGPKSAAPETTSASGMAEVSPVEDLMREHGVLGRILLIYEEIIRRIESGERFPKETVVQSTQLIRAFVQNYHEKLEERYLFPRFRKAHKLVSLVSTLEKQHKAGRKLIDEVIDQEKMKDLADKKKLAVSLRLFIRLYRPHKAREDTVLFPAFHTLVSLHEYDALGDRFEDEEQRFFGKNGFENIVKQVEVIEKALGIYKLSQFTPARYR